jgi:lysophospholipase L1-like esterase
VALGLIVMTALVGCGDDRPSFDLEEGSTVVLIGDSLLFQSIDEVRFVLKGAGLEPVVRAVPGAAIDGDPLIDWNETMSQLVAAHDPDAVVIELGTNGCGFCESLADGIDLVMEPARDVPQVLWVDTRTDAPVPEDPGPEAVNEAIRDAADRWDNLTVADLDELVDEDDIDTDDVHFTDEGQVHFAESLAAVLT